MKRDRRNDVGALAGFPHSLGLMRLAPRLPIILHKQALGPGAARAQLAEQVDAFVSQDDVPRFPCLADAYGKRAGVVEVRNGQATKLAITTPRQ